MRRRRGGGGDEEEEEEGEEEHEGKERRKGGEGEKKGRKGRKEGKEEGGYVKFLQLGFKGKSMIPVVLVVLHPFEADKNKKGKKVLKK